ncbi:BREX system P-loop protein BrxC [Tepidibacter mesophilus]|uniref:BREX system P-loop protein BrxC n=1 Tax=Tepidibacter mesophilus TaxID=655607 RepID=UPI000C071C5E|nr:BREX system P-loop protein BrxC [Tepidibacter mesophilus]
MQLKKMFDKDITRDIKGVIKVGQEDDTNVYQELEEYVVTRELSKHFSEFFEAYKKGVHDYTDKMGVWISGFFGSGKSHFLKILSYLLENKEVKGNKAISYFDDKIKDPMVVADMKMVGDITTDVVLFNIDSKSDSDSKSNKDAIVKVFMKVFNEMQGLCGSMPWLADLERQMIKDNSYETFKSKFKELSGSEWEESREDFYFEEDNIIEALSQTTKMSEEAARNWYNKAEENYSLSVEKFAQKVKEYIESKGKNHHVVFLVDEIGQYIGDDVGLMLNLQTVIEDLGTHCGGKAWVLVTSQQDIDSITKVKGNDFSKIQGRFNTRLNLSSANVDEVIKKRILLKNPPAKETLRLVYQDKEAILKNLITFSTDAAEMKTYKSEQDFIEVYPFIPYQFNLLQSVFTGIRLHGASGKHLSEGERSLLSAFQESATRYVDKEVGTLIPFSAFYETIEAFLDSNIRTVMIHAEDNDNLNDFDMKVLKTLFLIRYVKEIHSNIENIATLMVSNIDDDKIDLKKNIEGSLRRLLKETLIQKNGEEYIFLTNEEQDVNKEIQHIQVDIGETILKIGEEIFSGIYSDKKYKYNSRYIFDFNKIIDDRPMLSQNHEIGLKIITPYYDTGVELTEQELKMMSSRENNLIVKLPMDTSYLEEMEQILKIETYLRQKASTSSNKNEEIKIRKQREITERKERVTTLIIQALKDGDIFVNSQKLDIKSKNPADRINDGFKNLIENMYNKLHYMTDFIENERQLHELLAENKIQLALTDDRKNKLAIDDVNKYVHRNTERNIPMSIKSITTLYSRAPYGWRDLDIAGIVLTLFKEQEIQLVLNHEYLTTSDKDIVRYVTKRDYVDRLVIKKRIKTPVKYINNAKTLAKEVFNHAAVPSDEDGLMNRFKELCYNELYEKSDSIKELLGEYKNDKKYPGKDILEKGKEIFEKVIKIKDVKEFYEELYELQDDFLDYEESVYDIKKFFENQKNQFDKALHQLSIYSKNKTYVLDNETIEIVNKIDKIANSKKPYNEIQKLPDLINEFVEKFTDLLEEECKPVKNVIESDYKKVIGELELYDLKEELYNQFKNQFEDLLNRLDSANNFYEAIAMKEESDRLKIRCFDRINQKIQEKLLNQKQENQKKEIEAKDGEKPYIPKIKKTVNVSMSNILHGAKSIESKQDIDNLLNEIRRKLEDELKEDTIVKLI